MDHDSYAMLKHTHVGDKRKHSQQELLDYECEREYYSQEHFEYESEGGFGPYSNALEDDADLSINVTYGNCHSQVHSAP